MGVYAAQNAAATRPTLYRPQRSPVRATDSLLLIRSQLIKLLAELLLCDLVLLPLAHLVVLVRNVVCHFRLHRCGVVYCEYLCVNGWLLVMCFVDAQAFRSV